VKRLSGLDATFLYMETPTSPMHVMGVLLLDTKTAPEGYSFDKVREMLLSRIHLMPAFRRRLVPVPLGLAHPVWIEDAEFDLDNHLHRIGVPPPGDLRALEGVVGDIAGQTLDRGKPLWDMWVVEGLKDGRAAVITKMHHSTIDGTSGADVMVHLLDITPEVSVPEPPDAPFTGERRPSDLRLLGGALAAQAGTPVRAVKAVGKLAGNAVRTARGYLQKEMREASPPPFSAPRTKFSGALSSHRAVAFGGASLDDLKEIKAAFDGKVNDVVLAIATHAMRGYLEWAGELPDRPLVASCPISVRKETAEGEPANDSANQVSNMLVPLPVQMKDPVKRLKTIIESTKRSKELANAIGAETLMDWAEFLAPRLFTTGMRLYSATRMGNLHPPALNLIVSNVPGPPIPLYSAGARIVAIYPMGPLLPGAGINVTVLSNMGNVDFGVIADRETVPEIWRIADGLKEGVDVLLAAARAPKPSKSRAGAKRKPAAKPKRAAKRAAASSA
jgi:WS/DGAT/MGAT family acyltransferase